MANSGSTLAVRCGASSNYSQAQVGTLLGKTTFGSAGTIAPGNSPGALTITNGLTWAGDGNYNWQIFAVSGTAGQTNTWDLINVTGGTWDITGLSWPLDGGRSPCPWGCLFAQAEKSRPVARSRRGLIGWV